jgi:hypothetical protein
MLLSIFAILDKLYQKHPLKYHPKQQNQERPEPLQYRYRLKGKKWIHVGNARRGWNDSEVL